MSETDKAYYKLCRIMNQRHITLGDLEELGLDFLPVKVVALHQKSSPNTIYAED